MKRNIILILLLSISLLPAIATEETLHGVITNQAGEPMSAVIIEQKQNETYAISNLNGEFDLKINSKNQRTIICRYVGYFSRTIDISKHNLADTIRITMLPGNDADAELNSISTRTHVGGFAAHIGYQFLSSNFSTFTEFPTQYRAALNRNMHYTNIGVSGYFHNIFAKLSIGATPLFSTEIDNMRWMNEAYNIGFDIGYGFSVMQNRGVIITPYIGIKHSSYSEYIIPKEKGITLEHFIERSETDFDILQYIGAVGCNFSFATFKWGRNKQQGLYLVGDMAYGFKMHHYPIIFSKRTDIFSESIMSIFPLNASLTLQYVITTRQKSWKKMR